jgi:hypothetical protein
MSTTPFLWMIFGGRERTNVGSGPKATIDLTEPQRSRILAAFWLRCSTRATASAAAPGLLATRKLTHFALATAR